MSEYQYYEFLAVDRTLTPMEIQIVRGFSSRADISATRFQNEYQWGDFRGDVTNFLTRFYDLHLYYANWGTHTFGVGLSGGTIDTASRKPYFPKNGAAECSIDSGRVVLIFTSTSEGDDWNESGETTMAELAPLRDEILAGDLRPLYLGWLVGIFDDNAGHEDDADEPPVPAGLQSLTPAQKAFVRFMRIDEDMLAIAAGSSEPLTQAAPDPRPWIKGQASGDKDAWLVAVMEGRGAEVSAELRAQFRGTLPRADGTQSNRTAGELRAAAESARVQREKGEAEAKALRRAAKEAQAAKERAKYLDTIASTRENLWREVEQLIGTRVPKNYDACVKILDDLRAVAKRHDHLAEFSQRLNALRASHGAKTTLLSRMRKAGLA